MFRPFASPHFVTWWPKSPEPAEDASGASGCGGGACASLPRAPFRLARVSMKPRCRLHEPIRFINCSTSSFYSSIFIPNPGHFPAETREKEFAQEWDEPLIKAKQKRKDTKLIASSLSYECFGKKFFLSGPFGRGAALWTRARFKASQPQLPISALY